MKNYNYVGQSHKMIHIKFFISFMVHKKNFSKTNSLLPQAIIHDPISWPEPAGGSPEAISIFSISLHGHSLHGRNACTPASSAWCLPTIQPPPMPWFHLIWCSPRLKGTGDPAVAYRWAEPPLPCRPAGFQQ